MKNKYTHTCPVCKGNRIYILTLPYKTFRHLDFAEFRLTSGNIICECSNCLAVFRSFNLPRKEISNDLLDITNLYKSENYAQHQEEHMVREKDSGVMSPLSEVQAKIITGSLPTQSNFKGILDIGCFDGKLLASLKKRLNAERFLGFDVEQRAGFPYDLGIEFTKKPIEEITGEFDLILLSQSIMYIPDLEILFKNISRLLTQNGIVFIQVPDLSLRPCSALLGDQHHYFSKTTIKSMLKHFNYECSFFSNTPFTRDILLLAKLHSTQSVILDPIMNYGKNFLNEVTSHLSLMTNNIHLLSGDSNELAIFGTTIEAAFCFTLIPDRVLYFVDENPKKIGMTFQGKEVIHPQSLKEKDKIIIPMGKSGEVIRERLSNHYLGVYFCA